MTDLKESIETLKREKNAIVLAHFYQSIEIQEVADFVGDSLALAQHAARTEAEIIVLAGVHFMAETAKILNPSKKVLLPDLDAGCSLASSCPPNDFQSFIDDHPNHVVVTYVNCSAEIKAMSDIVCTSSNAENIINSIPLTKPIIFAPDKNLGKYLMKKCNRDLILWNGSCEVHEAFSLQKLDSLLNQYPEAQLIAHPESEEQLLEAASFVGSTSRLLDHVITSSSDTFIVATEVGIIHKMLLAVPEKTIIPAPINENNSCACSECAYMKMNTLEKLHQCLLQEAPEIMLDSGLLNRAAIPIQRMMDLS